MGSEILIEHVEARLSAKLGETTADGGFALEAVYCIGNCAHPPSLLLDGKPYGQVSAQVAELLIVQVIEQATVVKSGK
jgi:formate dehydrogenase subunit gamma